MNHAPRVNDHGQPIGPALPGWAPAPFPDVTPMQGRWCRVEPLLELHADELYDELCGPGNDALWTYLKDGPFRLREEFVTYIEARATATDSVSVLIRDANGVACGLASYLRIDRANGAVEVGNIILGSRLQRTTAATEAMRLLAGHVFDLGYRRYEWKCDALNAPSQRAAERLGFVHEGTFRQAVVYKGRSRDTDWWAITDADWPWVRRALDAWLVPENFVDGVQVQSLEALRASAG
ncbi:GNAT family protein [Nocardioides sp. AE5]|uniref:GNAT family N-acetyltransferase n=1 Tax=Nocardioides sp. AE5 TaxID=2962573 RepID=UPI002881E06C|nr:GNAT family protein [Nocardioides sp. AE5]MDT0202843.1 GNAT family protein [Nocardioides sp. AE5]